MALVAAALAEVDRAVAGNINVDDSVAWRWGNGLAEGTVKSVHNEPTTIESKGKLVKRNGTHDNPALIITHASGNDVIKLASEVQKTKKD